MGLKTVALKCENCGKRYILGKDAVVVSSVDVLRRFGTLSEREYARLTMHENKDDPDLVGSLPPGEEPSVEQKLRAEIICITQSSPRWWQCQACGHAQRYFREKGIEDAADGIAGGVILLASVGFLMLIWYEHWEDYGLWVKVGLSCGAIVAAAAAGVLCHAGLQAWPDNGGRVLRRTVSLVFFLVTLPLLLVMVWWKPWGGESFTSRLAMSLVAVAASIISGPLILAWLRGCTSKGASKGQAENLTLKNDHEAQEKSLTAPKAKRRARRSAEKPSASTDRSTGAEPGSPEEYLARLSARAEPVADRVRIAYQFEQYCEPAKEQVQQLLVKDSRLRKAILARYSTEKSARMDRLMGDIDEAALMADKEAARRKMPKDFTKLSDRDLRILRPDELVKLIVSARGEQTETLIRRVIKAAGIDGRGIVQRVFDADSEERAISRTVLHVLTQLWSEDDEKSAQEAADLFNGFGYEVDIRPYQDQQWFKDSKGEVIRVAIAVCDSAHPKGGPTPFAPRVKQAVNILSHLDDGLAIPTLQSLLAKLRQQISAEGMSREYVNDGRVFGYRSNTDSVQHIENAIATIAERSKGKDISDNAPSLGEHQS